jgi:hypothetical protein
MDVTGSVGLTLNSNADMTRVSEVFKKRLALDRRFDVDFNTAFATGPARPHGVALK